MVKLESLKKSNQFKKALKEKKTHTEFFSIFAAAAAVVGACRHCRRAEHRKPRWQPQKLLKEKINEQTKKTLAISSFFQGGCTTDVYGIDLNSSRSIRWSSDICVWIYMNVNSCVLDVPCNLLRLCLDVFCMCL